MSSSVLGRPIVGDQLTLTGWFVISLSKSQFIFTFYIVSGFPWWLSSKQSASQAGESVHMGCSPGSGRFLGEGNGNPFQYSCLRNLMDKGAWWATVHWVTEEPDMADWLNNNIASGKLGFRFWSGLYLIHNWLIIFTGNLIKIWLGYEITWKNSLLL